MKYCSDKIATVGTKREVFELKFGGMQTVTATDY